MAIARFGRQARTALARIGRQAKIPHGLCAKMTFVVILGMCFIFVWSFFSPTPDTLVSQRESFSDIAESLQSAANSNEKGTRTSHSTAQSSKPRPHQQQRHGKSSNKPTLKKKSHHKVNVNVSLPLSRNGQDSKEIGEETVANRKEEAGSERSENEALEKGSDGGDNVGDEAVVESKEEVVEGEGGEGNEDDQRQDPDLEDGVDVKVPENEEDDTTASESRIKWEKKKHKGPLFDLKAQYNWKSCNTRSKHNYIPCIDIESPTGKIQSFRHHERSCPRTPPMCLVPLPPDGYGTPVPWPESKLKILHKNVAHPKLDAYIKTRSWLRESGEYIVFPQNHSDVVNDVAHFLEAIEEMVPDIEWGKNVRVVLDIGVSDSSFVASLFDKDVLTLALGLKNDLVDLAQVAIERGFPAVVSPFATKRLPFPSGVFDAIHCSGCNIHWHSGSKLLEVNRILRPGGYFILSAKHNSIEAEEAMASLTASICWNVLADKADDVTEVGVKIYQKPESNSIYELRRKKNPPLCGENENPDAAWYVPIRHCLHPVPAAIEQHGTERPAEWPERLESYPDWLSDKEKVKADTEHWKAVVEKSYLTGIGVDWTNIRNVMDMKAIYGGFAAALAQQKVWVMNVVPTHAPNTLPYIYERGLIGIYHDWCESFGTYPRSYDLLHVDHLFSRLKNRCNQPVAIVVEMDRILRPGGWIIVRDKLVILEPLEGIFRSLNWDIRMTFAQGKEGILVAQKTTWRP